MNAQALAAALVLAVGMSLAPAQAATETLQRDGSHDFDFEIGTWRTELTRLKHPLSGSHDWVRYSGRSVVSKVWGGSANLVELDVQGPSGHLQALSLRLYDPRAHQWSLNYANAAIGLAPPPTIGGFANNRGEFYDREEFAGRWILVRLVITRPDPETARFEQAFSDDGGRTWETNWIATDTRVDGAA